MIRYLFFIIFPVIVNAQEASPPPVTETSSDPEIVNTPPPAPNSDPEIVSTPPPAPDSNPDDATPSVTSTTQIVSEPDSDAPDSDVSNGADLDASTVSSSDEPPSPEVEDGIPSGVGFGAEGIVLNYKIREENLNRDPFTRAFAQRSPANVTEIVTEFLDPKMPLESFPIEKLRLTGILWRTAAPRAVFLDPNGSSYIARKNERIGVNKGYIAAIREGEVVVIEPSMKVGHSYETEILRLESDVSDKVAKQEETATSKPSTTGRRAYETELLKIDTIDKMGKQ